MTAIDHLIDQLLEAFDPRWVESVGQADVHSVVDDLLDLEVKRVWDALKGVMRTRRRRRLGIRFPTSVAIRYKRWIQSYVNELRTVLDGWVENDLVPALVDHLQVYHDGTRTERQDSVDRITDKLEELKQLFYTLLTEEALQQQVEDYSRLILDYSKRQWVRSIHQIRQLDPLTNDARLEEILRAQVHENVRLIKSIPEKYFDDVERVVMDGVRKGKGIKEITEEITAVYPSKTAGLIARDQCGSFAGALSREHFSQAGLKTYIWRNMQDERVRGNPMGRYPHAQYSHWDREGKVFAWDDADGEVPEDGHPGFPIACRCWAQVQEEEALYDTESMVQPGEYYGEPPATATAEAPSTSPAQTEAPIVPSTKATTPVSKTTSLSDEELAAVHNWQQDGYTEIRLFERGRVDEIATGGWIMPESPQQFFAAETKRLYAALDKVPIYRGTVYRGLKDVDDVGLAALTRSGTITLDASASASKSLHQASSHGFGSKGNSVLLEVRSKTGADISSISSEKFMLEQEVVLRKGARYRVVSSSLDEDLSSTGVRPWYRIVLEEL